MIRGSNPGGGEIFHTHLDQTWGPPGLLHNVYRVSFLAVMQLGCSADRWNNSEHYKHLSLQSSGYTISHSNNTRNHTSTHMFREDWDHNYTICEHKLINHAVEKRGYVVTQYPRSTMQALPFLLTSKCDKLRVCSEQFGTVTDYCNVLGA